VYTLADKGGARIVRCNHCGLTQLDPLPSAEELESLYTDGYFEGVGTEVGYEEYAKQEREYLATFADDVRRISEFVSSGTVLDVGCGFGYFVRRALESGFDAYGVDLSAEGIREASKHAPGRVFCGTPANVEQLSGRRFNVIFASHLIEHIPEPAPFVADLVSRLEVGGILVLVTPNIESLLARLSGPRWVSFKIPEHVAYYTPSTLTSLVTGAGLRVQAIDSAYQYYALPFLMSRVRKLIHPLGKLVPHFENWPVFRGRMPRVTSGSMRMIAKRV
jgi:2-polyprenyl-3-methyl-5-hydroxy-6-metoxy-1,4-benzoquinol methylase